ncbi:Aldo/keto reductase [Cristinia sonorae]|uniref:Aldo/keto reductase n=1 Tax=Cristinia sonorae TaxID=1940300 RepID=A0A8K0V1H4_9AGAR|nr:Aldo/keto reductase [Cristinia sonorae]
MDRLTISSSVLLSSGYPIPRLGFGVYQNYTADTSVLEAFTAGYRHVDSAQAYRNEHKVGLAVKQSGLNREDIFLTTKCISKTHGYESTLKGVNKSLEAFGVDYIDLFLIHNPHSGKDLRLATYRALQDARKAGKIRTVGVSNYGVHHLEEIRDAGLEAPSVNQIELHPFCQQHPIVAYCNQHGIVVQAYCPIKRIVRDINDDSTKPFRDLGQKYGKDPAQIALRWSLQKGFVPLVKSEQPERIRSNADLYDFHLAEEDMALLDGLDMAEKGAISWNPVDVD